MQDKESAGRWVRAYWDDTVRQTFYVPLTVEIKTRVGALADIVTVFTNMKINIGELKGRDMEDGQSRYTLAAAVNSIEQLELLLNRIRRVSGVSSAERDGEPAGERKE